MCTSPRIGPHKNHPSPQKKKMQCPGVQPPYRLLHRRQRATAPRIMFVLSFSHQIPMTLGHSRTVGDFGHAVALAAGSATDKTSAGVATLDPANACLAAAEAVTATTSGQEECESSSKEACLLPGQVLMRQGRAAKGSSGSFLEFSEDVIGPRGCCLDDGEEIILVGSCVVLRFGDTRTGL